MKQIQPYKRFFGLLSLSIFLFFSSCKSPQATSVVTSNPETQNLLALMQQQPYTVEVEVAQPFYTAASQSVINSLLIPRTGNTASRIDITGDGHFISVGDGHVKSNLPFFGEQRQGSGHYGTLGNGINMAGEVKDYTIMNHKKKEAIVVKFTSNQSKSSTEHHDVIMTIFPNRHVEVSVVSSHRTTMNYSGVLKWLDIATL